MKKTAEITCDLIANKTADRISKVSKTLSKNNSERNEEEMLREIIIPQKLIYKIIDDLRLKIENYL